MTRSIRKNFGSARNAARRIRTTIAIIPNADFPKKNLLMSQESAKNINADLKWKAPRANVKKQSNEKNEQRL